MYKTYYLILISCLINFYSFSSEIQKKSNADIAKFYSLKKESKLLKKDNEYVIEKMTEYYLKKAEKNPDLLIKQLKSNSKKLEKSTNDFVIHSIVAFQILSNKNNRLTAGSIIHSLELKIPLIKDKKILADAEIIIGIYYQFLGENVKSRLHLFKALKHSEEIKNNLFIQNINFYIANTYYQDKNYNVAEDFILKALAIEKLGFSGDHYNMMILLCGIKFSKGDFDEALKIMLSLEDNVNNANRGSFYNHLGKLYMAKFDWEKAKRALIEAEKIFKDENSVGLEYAYTNLAICYSKLNDYKNSYKYTLLKEDIIKQQQKEASKLELERLKKQELVKTQKLEKKIVVEKLKLEKTRTVQLYIVLAFILLLLLSSLFFTIRMRFKNKLLVRMSLDKMELATANEINKSAEISKTASPILVEKFENIFYNKEIYKDPDLTIQKLAKKLGTNAKDLSQTINVHYNTPFRNLINEKRVELAQKLLIDKQYQNYSMEGIAQTVGYKNKSMFYLHFKNLTGVTPANFQTYALRQIGYKSA